jgi:pimeloyl-ACP methyl ester carboxylesterase
MHYVEAGSGPAVILLHGWPQTWFAWRDTIAALSSRFRLVAPDLRGTGLSERAASGYEKQTIAADIRVLIERLGLSKAHIVGHDMGGKAAFVLAKLYPEVVERLVLVDCLIPGTEVTDVLKGGAWHYGFHMAPDVPEMLTKGRERAYIAAQIRNWSFRKNAISEQAIDEFARHYAAGNGMTTGFNFYRALRKDADLVASLKSRRLTMPVLTIGGEHGAGENLAKAVRGHADDLRELIAWQSGHFVAEEAPEFFRQSVTQFLSGA